ncbi:P12 family lipoprotein [Borreliella valaisiana]|uniref:P12 family lipoprotein n=1 Tax=Borreliella valaisiana TaxID=62088 RepID=UPI003B21485B
MKKNILTIYMLMLIISLLSCNTSGTNELMNKKIDKRGGKILGFIEKIQESVEVVEQNVEEGKKQITPAVSENPVNVNKNFPYYSQEEIKIKEEELVPNTDEEKKAEKAINEGSIEFAKLAYDENKLKNESDQIESSFNEVYDEISGLVDSIKTEMHIVGRINHIIKTKPHIQKEYQKRIIQNRQEKQNLINLFNQLLEKRGDIEELNTQLDSGLSERESAKYFFEKAQKTLKDAITERLKTERKNWSRRTYNNLARQSKNEMDNALRQLNTSSSKIVKAREIKKEIEQLIQKAKSFLDSSKNEICSDNRFVIFNR